MYLMYHNGCTFSYISKTRKVSSPLNNCVIKFTYNLYVTANFDQYLKPKKIRKKVFGIKSKSFAILV